MFAIHLNMADHSVGARNEPHESEASQALVICFDNASPEKSCSVVDLVCFISLCLRVAVLLNATRRPGGIEIFHRLPFRENSRSKRFFEAKVFVRYL